MSNKTFSNLLEEAAEREDSKILEKYKRLGIDTTVEQVKTSVAILSEMFKTNCTSKRVKTINMAEALASADASVLFPKVFSDVLLRPREPLMIGQTLLAKTIKVDNVRSMEFPVLGSIRAFQIGEGQEYPEQIAAVSKHLMEIKVWKHGLKVALNEDIVKDSMWDLLALYVEAAGFAMLRWKEEQIFNEFTANGHKVYDNSLTDSSKWTSGRNSAQNMNFSVAYNDLIYAMGGLVANGYVPTDVIMHPLAWSVFATDPIIRNVMYTQSQIGQSVWNSAPQFDQQHNVPWNLNYQVSPFVPLTLSSTITSNSSASGLPACNLTDIYIVDRNNCCIVLQREDMSTEQFDNPERDIVNLKFKERYGVGAANGGRAAAVLSNVRLAENFQPFAAYYSVTPA